MAKATVPYRRDAQALTDLLDSPEISDLIASLEATRWTGRPGYPIRAMVGMALVKSLNCHPTWTRTVRLVADHAGLQAVLGCAPSLDACYRFTRKLRLHHDRLTECVDAVLARLAEAHPEMGTQVAIDGSDLPAYANGQRFVFNHGPERKVFSDPDASWGHRSAIATRKGGGYYGYKVHAVVDVATELPVAWEVRTAKDSEAVRVPDLLDATRARGFDPTTAILTGATTKRPSTSPVRTGASAPSSRCARRRVSRRGWQSLLSAPTASGRSQGLTSSARRPSGAARPASAPPPPSGQGRAVAHPRPPVDPAVEGHLPPARLRRARLRAAQERVGMLPLRVRRIERVQLHVHLTILAQLAIARQRPALRQSRSSRSPRFHRPGR